MCCCPTPKCRGPLSTAGKNLSAYHDPCSILNRTTYDRENVPLSPEFIGHRKLSLSFELLSPPKLIVALVRFGQPVLPRHFGACGCSAGVAKHHYGCPPLRPREGVARLVKGHVRYCQPAYAWTVCIRGLSAPLLASASARQPPLCGRFGKWVTVAEAASVSHRICGRSCARVRSSRA